MIENKNKSLSEKVEDSSAFDKFAVFLLVFVIGPGILYGTGW